MSNLPVSKRCLICGKEFSVSWYTRKRKETCSPKCRATLGHQRSGKRVYKMPPGHSELRRKIALEQHRKVNPKLRQLDDYAWLHKHYTELGWGQEEIAAAVGCTRMAINAALKRAGIVRRTEHSEHITDKWSGEKNWRWKGGVYNHEIIGKEGSYWRRARRRKILIGERGEKCEWCGKTGVRIELHHIAAMAFSGDNSPENLLLLCTKCHGLAEKTFRRLAANFYASHGFPGLHEHVSTLKLKVLTAT